MASLDWSQCPEVESVPGKVSGAWVLRGTRMPVAAIFENIEARASIDDIMEWFDGLDREQVKVVIELAARSLDKGPIERQAILARTAGALSPEEADELDRVIEEGCEKTDEHGW